MPSFRNARTAALCLGAFVLLSGCRHLDPSAVYEREQLMIVQHNSLNDYTLLTYQDRIGQMRHVLRRGGYVELIVTYTATGGVELRERGGHPRTIGPAEAGAITRRINALLKEGHDERPEVSSI